MKKLSFILALILFTFILTGCKTENYSETKEPNSFEDATNTDNAIASDLVNETETTESEYVDDEFIKALCDGLTKRTEIAASNPLNADDNELVQAELSRIEKYYNEPFENEVIQELARNYIDGVKEQQISLSLPTRHEQDFAWINGALHRYQALNGLYEINTSYFISIPNFYENYIYIIPTTEKNVDICNFVNEELSNITSSEPNKESDHEYSFTFYNNSEYQFGIGLIVSLYDVEHVRIGQNTEYTQDIKPEETVKLNFRSRDDAYYMDFDWVVIK